MNEPREHDPLIDACLDEVLGGARPTDVTARVLARLATALDATAAAGEESFAPLSVLPSSRNGMPDRATDPTPPPRWSDSAIVSPSTSVATHAAANGAASPRKTNRAISRGIGVAALISVAACGGFVAWRLAMGPVVDAPNRTNVATNDPTKDQKNNTAPPLPESNSAKLAHDKRDPADSKSPGPSSVATEHESPSVAPRDEQSVEAPLPPTENPSAADPSTIAASDSLPGSESSHNHASRERRDPAVTDREMVAFVNQKLRDAWSAAKIAPSPPATDAEWCRRVYLRLLGRVPRREELERFTANKSKSKRVELVDRLMNAQETRDEYARHWASVWANVLIGRSVGLDPQEPASRAGLESYLAASVRDDKPYDRWVIELLTASGWGQPDAVSGAQGSSSEPNGAANFVLANHSDNGALLAAKTSRVFLGTQLQCAQCHNHPTNEWTQHQFWAFDSFFRQIAVERDEQGRHVVAVRDFAGESGTNPAEAEVFYEQRNGLMKAAYPAFLDGTEIPRDGRVAQVDRRRLLAEWIVKNDRLGVAVANRLWSHFLGYGFTRPIDDIGGENQPSHPELLNGLAREFAAEGFSLKRLSKWIVLSDAFSRSSKVGKDNLADAPESGAAPLFARYYTRQLQPEEVFQSLINVAKLRESDSSGDAGVTARVQWMGQFARDMQTDEGDEESSFNGSMRQQLTMMNGELMRRATRPGDGNLLETVANAKMTFDEKIDHLFLSAVARKPTPKELEVAKKLRGAGVEADALSDIWWALLNSSEFILDH